MYFTIKELKRINSLPSHFAVYRVNGKNYSPEKFIIKIYKTKTEAIEGIKEAKKEHKRLIKELKYLHIKTSSIV